MVLTNGQLPLYASGSSGNQQVYGVLPSGVIPDIFMDFKNGVYQSQGENVALNTLLVQNLDFGSYTEAHIQAGVGLVGGGSGDNPVLAGDALALVLDGATAIYTMTLDDDVSDRRVDLELIDSTNYNLYYYSTSSSNFDNGSGASFIGDSAADDVSEPCLPIGSHIKAVTMIDGKIERSTDGNQVISIDPAAPWSPAPAILHIGIGIGAIVEEIAIYPAQPVGDLPSLSANGNPVNTAAPAVTGTAQVGQTLSCSTGTWTGATSYAYQWLHNGGPIIGATSSDYVPIEDNIGALLACIVTATNATGSYNSSSNQTDPVIEA